MQLQRLYWLVILLSFHTIAIAKPVADFLPKNVSYNQNIARPKATLGFEIGDRHVRYDQLKQYFTQLSQQANRVKLTSIGKTAQWREQFLVTISSPENLKNLQTILQKRHIPSAKKKSSTEPLVIWLGYSVHGDEISGANAAMVVAYYLAASQESSIEAMLANTIIVLEPSINPDGMDRFVNWVSNYRGSAANSDANHIEHHQDWITGRTNHFWFDLNRDWLLLSQQESQHRLKYYHQYQPNVLGDYHEMNANSSYFFQPGIESRTNPITPKQNFSLTKTLAKYHAQALDKAKRLYYTEESFDDFYYGKGSTYPDINGGIGILFEQASARGMQQNTINGLLTFEYGIQNHVLMSLSTIKGAWENRQQLQQYRYDFYQQALKEAKKSDIKGYILQEGKDLYRMNLLLDKLAQHQINVYPLTKDFDYQNKNYLKANSYFVPLEQPQYRLIQALFTQQTNFPDNTFYDVSGWTLPLAMNIDFAAVDSTWGLSVAKKSWQKEEQHKVHNTLSSSPTYAYAFEWHNTLAPKLLNNILKNKIKAKVATGSFSSEINGKKHRFEAGTIVIPAGIQTAANWQETLVELGNQTNLALFRLTTGLTSQGIDIGSTSFKTLTQPKVLLIGGKGVSQYEAGEVRYYLDEILNIPVSVIDYTRIDNIDLSVYSHIVFVNGDYRHVTEKTTIALKTWIKKGGVVIGQKRGAKWLAAKDILVANFVHQKQIDQLFDTGNMQYQDKEKLAARKRIAGAIFATELDTSHPLTFGYQNDRLPMFRNSTLIMEAESQPFISVAKYTATPLLSGYTDENLVNRLAYHPASVAHNYGQGRVIATTDVLAFRGYWFGSAKLLANSLFFAKLFSTPVTK